MLLTKDLFDQIDLLCSIAGTLYTDTIHMVEQYGDFKQQLQRVWALQRTGLLIILQLQSQRLAAPKSCPLIIVSNVLAGWPLWA